MELVDLNKIEVRKRQRGTISSGPLSELKESILERGLLNPPVCWYDPATETWVLVAGERRLKAIQTINQFKPTSRFHCGKTEVMPGLIPITPLGEYLDEVGRFEAEFDENVQRVDLNWQEKASALAALHEMRRAARPEQTFADTGRELVERGVVNAKEDTARPGHSGAVRVREATLLAAYLEDPAISKSRTAEEALQLIYKRQEEKAIGALARRQVRDSPDRPVIEIRHGDCTVVLPALGPSTFDFILVDPPYGVAADAGGYRARTIHHHNYEDSPDEARNLIRSIVTEGFRITKHRANLMLFHDIHNFSWLTTFAANMGWVPFPRPLIWQKSESEGMAPWAGQGPRVTCEYIFYATKGQRGLHVSPTDIFNVKRVSRSERLHAAEKPVELLRRLIECATLPGDSILDPCAGSGSTLVAARECGRIGLGIEKDQTYYDTALANLFRNTPQPETETV